jgi:hypothetical protein
LSERLEILGHPEVIFTLASDRPNALVAVLLCDVAPTGESTLVTRGLLNLTHREGHEEPTPLEPGKRYTVTVRLNAMAYAFPRGHCLRVGISPTYWPWAWPSPEPVTMSVFAGKESRLELPVRSERAEDARLRPFEPPEVAPPLGVEALRGGSPSVVFSRDMASGRSVLEVEDHHGLSGSFRLPSDGLEWETTGKDVFTIFEGAPLSATVQCKRTARVARGGWRTRIETASKMSSDKSSFTVTNILEAFEDDVRVFSKVWTHLLPRDLV